MEKVVWFGDYIPLPRFLKDEAATFASFTILAKAEPPITSRAIEDIGYALKDKVLSTFVHPPKIIEELIYVRKGYKDPETGAGFIGSIAWRAKISLDDDSVDFKLNPFKIEGEQ